MGGPGYSQGKASTMMRRAKTMAGCRSTPGYSANHAGACCSYSVANCVLVVPMGAHTCRSLLGQSWAACMKPLQKPTASGCAVVQIVSRLSASIIMPGSCAVAPHASIAADSAPRKATFISAHLLADAALPPIPYASGLWRGDKLINCIQTVDEIDIKFMRSKFLLIAVCFVVFQVKAATASTAEDMLEFCDASLQLADDPISNPLTLAKALRCIGLAEGIATLLAYNCSSRDQGYLPMFTAEAPTVDAAIAAFVVWVHENPDSRGERAVDVMIAALMAYFPCQQ